MVTKLWAKIVITCIAVMSVIIAFAYSNTLDKLEKSNTTIDYVIDRDTSYLDCVDNEDNIDNIIDHCVIPLTKELLEIYDNK